MSPGFALDWFREMLWVATLTAGPAVLVVVIVGLLIAIVQAATQVNDQAVAFGPKAVSVVVALAAASPWMLQQVREFTVACFDAMTRVGP